MEGDWTRNPSPFLFKDMNISFYNRLISFLIDNKLVNKSELARMMYPEVKSPYRKLHAKLTGTLNNGSPRSFNDNDYDRLEKVIFKFSRDLDLNLRMSQRTYPNQDLSL